MMGFGKARSIIAACTIILLSIIWHPAPTLAAPPVSTYGQLPGFEMAAISQSGDHIALIGRAGEKRLLIISDRNNKVIQNTPLGDIKVRGLYWAGDATLLIHYSNTASLGIGFTTSKAELTDMIVVPLDGGKIWPVFKKNSLITGGVQGFHGLSRRNGKWYGSFGGATLDKTGGSAYLSSADPLLYEVDLQSGKVKKLANRTENQENYRSWLINGDGQISATFDYYSRSGRWTIRNNKRDIIAEGTNPLGNIHLISLGNTPDTIIYAEEDQNSGIGQWFELPLSGGAPKEILDDVSVSQKIIDNRTRRFIGYEIDGDRPSYHFYDPFHQKVIEAVQKAFPGLSMELIDWNDSFTRLIVKTQGIGDPISWHIVDIKSGKADILGTSYPMKSSDVGPMKMIRYMAQDGLEIEAVLTLPPDRDPKNLPVIILPHGGPTARDYPGFDWWAQAFASRGYAVLQPNFRGSSGYGASFEQAGHGEWGLKMQTDISDGLAHLVMQGIAAPKRACIMGASYGGYAALAGVTLQQGLYRCAVSIAGVSDVAKWARTEIAESANNAMVRRALKEEIGSGRDLKMVSPINFADRADAPILMIHGKDDTVVLYDQSNDMADALSRAGKPVEFVTLKGEDHWLSKSETRMQMLEAAITFITKHNPPDPTQAQEDTGRTEKPAS